MKSITKNEREVLTVLAGTPTRTLKGIGLEVCLAYRGTQDLVARLCRGGYLVRAGHGRGHRLSLTEQGRAVVGDLPVANVPKRKRPPVGGTLTPLLDPSHIKLLGHSISSPIERPKF